VLILALQEREDFYFVALQRQRAAAGLATAKPRLSRYQQRQQQLRKQLSAVDPAAAAAAVDPAAKDYQPVVFEHTLGQLHRANIRTPRAILETPAAALADAAAADERFVCRFGWLINSHTHTHKLRQPGDARAD
jgi:hypothetical protein